MRERRGSQALRAESVLCGSGAHPRGSVSTPEQRGSHHPLCPCSDPTRQLRGLVCPERGKGQHPSTANQTSRALEDLQGAALQASSRWSPPDVGAGQEGGPPHQAGADPHLQVDEDGHHVRRAEDQPQGCHVVLQERSPRCPTARRTPSRPRSLVQGGSTGLKGQVSPDRLSAGRPLGPAHSRALPPGERGLSGETRESLCGASPVWGQAGSGLGTRVSAGPPPFRGGQSSTGMVLAHGAGLQPQGNQGGLCYRCLRHLGKMRFPWEVRGITQGCT